MKPAFVTLFALCLSACSHFQPAIVTNDTISNPTVGFNGYETKIPRGYIQIENITTDNEADLGFITETKKWIEKKRNAPRIKHRLRDMVALYDPENKCSILFMIGDAPSPVPLMNISYFNLKQFLKPIMLETRSGVKGSWEHTSFNNRPACIFSGTEQCGFERIGKSDAIYFGDLKEIFLIEGISKDTNPAKIHRDVSMIMKNTRIK